MLLTAQEIIDLLEQQIKVAEERINIDDDATDYTIALSAYHALWKFKLDVSVANLQKRRAQEENFNFEGEQ